MAEEYRVKEDNGIRSSLSEFCQNTTFHGLRYIGSSGSRIRRFMWLVFVLACLTGVVIQIVDRVQHFRSWPVNVNVKINYNQTLKFPAVTICNQNAFRATKAAEHGYYDLIEEMFSGSAFNASKLSTYGAGNLTVDRLYTDLAHNKNDFIVKCEWNKRKCSADDFDVILTDHGVCFIFKQLEEDMFVSASGVDAGLQMTLNVEQYEYMTGPHDAAGVKILLHEPREMPFVHELGQAVPTGSHAFIGIKFTALETLSLPYDELSDKDLPHTNLNTKQIENLPRPYGECADKHLPHTDIYTSEECYSDCLVKLAEQRCGCRDMYMPHAYGEPPVCTLHKYYTCLEDLKVLFETTLRETCACPIPCGFSIFDPSISYATISNHVVDRLLTTGTVNLKQNLLEASEVTARYDEKKFNVFKQIANELIEKFNIIKNVLAKKVHCLQTLQNRTEEVKEEIYDVYKEKERLYRFQEYAVQKNFLRGREAMEERTLRNVPNAYAEFAANVRRRIERLAAMDADKESEREQLYNLIMDSLIVRQQITEQARANITLLIESFINGTKIFNYKFEDTPRSHNPYIIPKPLLNYSMHHNWYMLKYVPKLKTDDFDLFEFVFERFKNETIRAYIEGTVNDTDLNYVYERYQYACRTFLFSKSVVYSQGIDMPLQVLEERHLDFDDIWNRFNSQITVLNQSFIALSDRVDFINIEIIPAFEDIMNEIKRYIVDGGITLIDLAGIFISNKTLQYERSIDTFFQEIQTRGQTIQDSWNLMFDPVYDMWDDILNDEDAVEYYNFTNNVRFMQNISDVMDDWNNNISQIQQNDIRASINHADSEFVAAFSDVFAHLEGFKRGIRIDGNFLKQNFLRLDVFFRQLSYEQVHQQKAYDFFALICDIGGAMGLFIGASMLTVVEIFDLFLTQTPIFSFRAKRKSPTF